MTEDDAQHWLVREFGLARKTKLDQYVALLQDHAVSQNLIAPSTVEQIWNRHIVDSAQLLKFAPSHGHWLDVGSGAGLPGLVVAILSDVRVELVDPRRLRTEFLEKVTERLDLPNVTVATTKVERTTGAADIISARAVAHLDRLFQATHQRAHDGTVWILPKGRNAHSEVEAVRQYWHGTFHVEQSITAPDALIVIAEKVRPK